jgi:hypothetical protein
MTDYCNASEVGVLIISRPKTLWQMARLIYETTRLGNGSLAVQEV